jgi:ubiquinone/menaquinone biosynthesis C-methylase UbiE
MGSGENKGKGYVHGYSEEEQNRLYEQARFLERLVYEHIDFSKQTQIVEVGCGVGAQTEILLERFPHLNIQGIDASQTQINRAKKHLTKYIAEKRVSLTVGDAGKLPFADNAFDGAFVCWFLEHVPKPIDVLVEIRRVLKPESVLYCNEAMHAAFFLHPYSPATLQYWFTFNDHQWNLGGDPFLGAKLGNYLMAAGYQDISTEVKTCFYDNRAPKMRAKMFDVFTKLLLSGTPALLEAKRTTLDVVNEMKKELAELKTNRDAAFFYSWIQAWGRAL